MLNKTRILMLLATALILLVPLVAMQFTDELAWDVVDFAGAAVLFVGAGLIFELAAKKLNKTAYRVAIGLALVATVVLIWIDLAVGIA